MGVVTGEFLAAALEAHAIFVDRLEAWHAWMMQGYRPSNAEALMLHRLIRRFLDERSPGGRWENNEHLPTFDEMKDAIDFDNPQSRYRRFESEVLSLREEIDTAAYKLVHLLNSESLIDEFETLSLDQQALYAGALSQHLASSQVGLSFMVSTVTTSHPSGKQHVFSLDRFLNDPAPFTPGTIADSGGNDDVVRRLAQAYASFHLQMVPALMGTNIGTFTSQTLNFIFKYFPTEVAPEIIPEEDVWDRVLQLEELLVRVRDHTEEYRNLYSSALGKQAVAQVLLVAEFANVYIVSEKLARDPSVRAYWELGSAVADLSGAVAETVKALTASSTLKLGSTVTTLTVVFGVYDAAMAFISASDAWEDNDLSVAIGHGMQCVGFSLATAVSIWGISAEVGLLGGMVGLGAALLILGGQVLIQYTQDPLVEQWLEHNYLGTNWHNVTVNEGPEDLRYKFKRFDTTPDIGRQVATIFSMLYPIKARIDWNVHEPNQATLVFVDPVLVTYHAEIAINRIVDQGAAVPERYSRVPIYQAPVAELDPDLAVDPVRLFYPTTPQPDDRLQYWSRPFTFFELSGLIDPNFNPEGTYLEIEILPNDRISVHFTGLTGTTGLLGELPVVLRERLLIPPSPN